MTLRDVMTQEEHAVTERAASRGMEPAICCSAASVVDRLTMLEASNGFAIPPMEKAQIIKLRAHIASAHPVITIKSCGLGFRVARSLSRNRRSPVQSAAADAAEHRRRAAFAVQARVRAQCAAQAAFDALKHLALDELGEDLLADATRDSETS